MHPRLVASTPRGQRGGQAGGVRRVRHPLRRARRLRGRPPDPLEIGGDNSLANLWPEKGAIPNRKDALEDRLHTLVCDGQLTLATAQHAIAANWTAAYTRYVQATAPAPAAPHTTAPHTTEPVPSAAPAPPTQAGHPAGATALCNDGTYSYSAHHQGSCSHHHGVAIFFD